MLVVMVVVVVVVVLLLLVLLGLRFFQTKLSHWIETD